MATFKTPDGGRVRTFRVGDDVEFVHYDRTRRVTATVRKTDDQAAPIVAALRIADGLTFCRTYGGAARP